MRQLGTLSSEADARRFAAWLVSQRIEAHAEQEQSGWVVWVRDEDQLPAVREALAQFRANPADTKYQDAERSAEALLREEEARRRQAQGNVVEMRGRWGSAGGALGVKKKAPLTKLLIGTCVLLALLCFDDMLNQRADDKPPSKLFRMLLFVDKDAPLTPGEDLNIWTNVRRSEIWRVITPIFIHFGLAHLAFNLMALFSFGASIEDRRGSLFFLILVLGLAISSNIGQALEYSIQQRLPSFGGMSGVVFGLFGYLFIKSRYDSKERYFLHPATTLLVMLWFALCILRDIPPFDGLLAGAIPAIANTAHAVGLIAGAVIAYVPLVVRKPAQRIASAAMDSAVKMYQRAVERFRAGTLAEAEQICRQIVAVDPRHADAWNLLGAIAYHNGQDAVAAACLTRTIQINREHANAHNNLGSVLKRQGKLAEAIAAHQRAVELNPTSVEALNNLGSALQERGELNQAAVFFRQAVALQPGFAQAHFNLGVILQQQGENAAATDAYCQAIRLMPTLPGAHFNLGIALKEQHKIDEAIAAFHRAAELNPDNPRTLHELGVACHHLGRLDDALACYRRVLQIDPDHAQAHFHQAVACLGLGDFQRGWPEYEWRWRTGKQRSSIFPQPLWQGESLGGKRILLWAEQGLGDTMQFIRFAKNVKSLAANVIVRCQPPLLKLLQTCLGIDCLIPEGDALPAFDCHAPLLSVPGIVGTTLENIPANVPYLFAESALVSRWREKLQSIAGFRVGINWQGGAISGAFGKRQIPVEHFATLAEIPDVQLISLQKGAALPESHDFSIDLCEFATTNGAFIDSAAVMKNLDLVITSDTSIAHLAGALGVPVWVALPVASEWRWLQDRTDSPWYPTMRLFRQQTPGDWGGVFEEIQAALQQAIQSAAHQRA